MIDQNICMFNSEELVQLLTKMTPFERMQYYINTIRPFILKDSTVYIANSREEGIENYWRNAAILFGIDKSELEDTKYGLMPLKVFEQLFKDHDVEYNLARNERSAEMVWVDKIRPDIDEIISKCKRANMSIKDSVDAMKQEYLQRFGKYKNDPNKIKWEKICFDKFIEPYLDDLINDKNQNSLLIREQENPVIFDEVFLNSFYLAFRDDLWNDTGIEDCKNWFRVKPIGRPDYKVDMGTYFCYAVNQIKDKIIVEYKPKNFNNWIKPTIKGNNFSGLKGRKENAKIKQKYDEIDRKIKLIK